MAENAVKARVTMKVKNKMPAQLQVTAEQLLIDAQAFQETDSKAPKQKIFDTAELQDYRMMRRKQYEDNIRKNRLVMNNYLKYAAWEENQHEFDRARSIYERGLDVDARQASIWLKYAEMEMRHRFINRARNVWNRAITLLPRLEQFWFKYAYFEEMLGNIVGARAVFERWMNWAPDENAWTSYVKFELRYNEIERARYIYERYVTVHPVLKAWIRFAKFEERGPDKLKAREVYERAVNELGEDALDERLFLAFAKYEENMKEYERARVIFKYSLEQIPRHQCENLYKAYVQFEKQYGTTGGIEDVIIAKRRFQYEEEIKGNPLNYDVWFDYIRLEEGNGDLTKTREVYERAIGNIPPAPEKKYWVRYIYLWLNYAIFEELEANDIDRARDVYKQVLRLIPHKKFTFAKVWLMAANLEVRQKNLKAARTLLGQALGLCPKEKIYRDYIQLELQLGEIDRCRMLYQKFLEFNPANCQTWVKFAELEHTLGELERCRGIYELAVSQPLLDMPEFLWKSYIDLEIAEDEASRARELYERLLGKTKHVKVWISFAQFECSVEATDRARLLFSRAYKDIRPDPDTKDQRVMLVEAWLDFEKTFGTATSVADVQSKMPKKIKKRRPIHAEDGTMSAWEEYFDYIFPDEMGAAPNLRLLEAARMWKKQKTTHTEDDGSGSGSGSEQEQDDLPLSRNLPTSSRHDSDDDDDENNDDEGSDRPKKSVDNDENQSGSESETHETERRKRSVSPRREDDNDDQ